MPLTKCGRYIQVGLYSHYAIVPTYSVGSDASGSSIGRNSLQTFSQLHSKPSNGERRHGGGWGDHLNDTDSVLKSLQWSLGVGTEVACRPRTIKWGTKWGSCTLVATGGSEEGQARQQLVQRRHASGVQTETYIAALHCTPKHPWLIGDLPPYGGLPLEALWCNVCIEYDLWIYLVFIGSYWL